MSLAALRAIAALALWTIPAGILAVSFLDRGDDDLDAEDRLGIFLAVGMATVLLGSQILALTHTLTARTFLSSGLVVAGIAITAMVTNSRLRHNAAAVVGHWKWLLIIPAIGAIAATPQILDVLRFPSSFSSPTPWYYFNLGVQTIAAKGFPTTSLEWGTTVPFLDDYPGFTALTAALSLATGRPELTFGAQLVRVVGAIGTGTAFFYLARAWGASRLAASGAVLALMATTVYATKTLSYRPEAFSYLLMFLSAALAKRWLDRSDTVLLVAGALSFIALAQVHGLGWLVAAMMVGATALTRVVLDHDVWKTAARTSLVLIAVFAIAWAVTTFALQGRLTEASKLDTAPTVSSDEVDPTWEFASFGTRGEGQPPPTVVELASQSATRGFYKQPSWVIGLIALISIVSLTAASVRGHERRRSARGTLMLVALVVLASIAVAALFAVGWATYVPRRTGTRRILQIIVFIVPLAAAVGVSTLPGRIRTTTTALWVAASIALASLAAPPLITLGEDQRVPSSVLTLQRSLDLSGGLILANAYTEGYLPSVFGSPGLLDGRAPYTEAQLLARANDLLEDSRSFFADPGSSSFAFGEYGIGYLVVSNTPWVFGTRRYFTADLDALRSHPGLSIIVENDYFTVFGIADTPEGRADG